MSSCATRYRTKANKNQHNDEKGSVPSMHPSSACLARPHTFRSPKGLSSVVCRLSSPSLALTYRNPLGYNLPGCGPVAQLGARFNRTEEVEGSNPSRSTFLHKCGIMEKLGPIAQLGARLNGIEKVEGSNPSGSTGVAGHVICQNNLIGTQR